MRKRTFLGVMVVGLAVVVMAGGLLASNMGFKLNYHLEGPTAPNPPNPSGTSSLALPDNRQSGLNTALDLMTDIGGVGFPSVANIQMWDGSTANGRFVAYTGRMGAGAPFALTNQQCYLVKMLSPVNYIVVGSDNPTLGYNFAAPGVGNPSGTTSFSFNYHQTAATALDLMNDITFANVANVQKWDGSTTNGRWVAYTGRMGAGTPFNLVPGECYLVKMTALANYVPSHY